MGAKLANSRPQAVARDPLVLCVPEVPMFPLRAAHPSEHDRHAFTVGSFEHRIVSNLQFPAKQVEAKILRVAHDGCVALGIIPEEQIGWRNPATNKINIA